MSGISLYSVLAHLRRLQTITNAAQRSDWELLRAFVANNDQDAFAAVVTRHAPLVWGVCRRILRHQQDAEDAFQATFLILARRAGSIPWRSSISGWLHTVAQRLAVRVRKQAEQRRILERAASRTAPSESSLRELAAVVDEELRQLPAKYREPLLLHYLQGATAEAAARQLGLRRSTFYHRLAHGRELLRSRLSRQGISLSASLLTAALASEADATCHSLIPATVRTVTGIVPDRVATLAADALSIPAVMKLKIGLTLGLLLGFAAIGVSMWYPREAVPPLPQAERPADSLQANDKAAVHVDRYGDPLPPGALARLGTLRYRVDANRVEKMAFAPDGKTLAAISPSGLTLFDVGSGKQTKRINPSDTGFDRLAYSSDGKRLMTSGYIWSHAPPRKMLVQTWDVASGRKLADTKLELEAICWLGWSEEGQPRAACLGNDEIVYHELETGRKLRLPAKDLLNPQFYSLCRCIGADNLLAASGANGEIHIWDLTNGKERFKLQAGVYVMSLALSADGRWLASVARDAANKNPVQLWDTSTGKVVRMLPPAHEVRFAPDGKTLATKTWTEILFWDAASGQQRSSIRTGGYALGPAFAFAPDSKTVATTGRESRAIQLWSVADGTLKPQPQGHSDSPIQAVFSADGKRVASCGTMDGTIRLWDSATGEPLLRIQRRGMARNCTFSADGRTLYSCWTDDKLYFHDAASGRELHVVKVEDPERPKFQPSGLSLHLSSDRTRLTLFHTDDAQFNDMLVTVWDADTRKQLSRRRRTEDAYWNALSADGRTLAAAFAGPPLGGGMPGRRMAAGPMHLEDLASGETLLTFPSLPGQTVPMAFSRDGRLLLSYTDGPLKSGERGVTLRLWEVLTTTELRTFPTSFGTRVAFTPDGRLLAMPTEKKEILVWDLAQDKEHRRFHDFDSQVQSLAFAPDGRRLVSGLYDSTLLVWDVGTPPAAAGAKLGAEGAAKAWTDLASTDAPNAFRARRKLAAAPKDALLLLQKQLHPAQSADPHRLQRLLADLDSTPYAAREKAQEELQKLGSLAEPALRQALANKPTLEMRHRVQAVLDRLRGPITRLELLQALRAVAVLEDIGTPEARRLLGALAQGSPEARLTREAKKSLQRLEKIITSK